MSDSPVLVCIGNLTIDEAVSASGQHVESVGGDALFAALAARLAGADSVVVAPLGNDASAALLSAIRSTGTDPATLPRRERPTVRNIVRYDELGGRTWDLVLGEPHFDELSVHPSDLTESALAAPGILVSGMALPAQLRLAAWLPAHTSAVIFFDPQEDYIVGNEAAVCDAVRECDVFLPSEVEATALAGTSDLGAAAQFLLDLGPHTVVIKRAEAGCLVATREAAPVQLAAEVVDPVDSTGAGDSFCGAFAAQYLMSADALAAARAGMAAARIAVSANGIDALLAAVAGEAVR
ncbi:MAG: carbohydrate kinase family protein [Mycobacterium sp.]